MHQANKTLPPHEHKLGITQLSRKNAAIWLLDAFCDWGLIVAAIAIALQQHSIFIYAIAIFVVGNRQHALAVLGHEGAHFTIHNHRKLNDALSNIFCFWPLLITTAGYRDLHFTHHKTTGSANDPELMHKKARAPQWDLPLKKSKIIKYALKDMLGYSLPDLLIILTFSKPKDTKLLLPIIPLHCIFIGISIMSGYWMLPLIWYGSLATTFMMFFRFRLWLEHQGTFDTQRIKLNLMEAAIFAPHKIWLHWEHHLLPGIPYYNLEKARASLSGPEVWDLPQLITQLSESAHMPSGAYREV